VPEASAL